MKRNPSEDCKSKKRIKNQGEKMGKRAQMTLKQEEGHEISNAKAGIKQPRKVHLLQLCSLLLLHLKHVEHCINAEKCQI